MPNAAAFTTQCRGIRITQEKNLEISMPNVAVFATQCRGIQLLWRNLPEVRDFNAAIFSHECRGIRSQTQKNKTAHSRVFLISSLFFPNHWNPLKQNPKHTLIPKYPTLQTTKFISQNLKPNIQKPKLLLPIYTTLIPKDIFVGKKSPKLLLLWILFQPSKCSYFLVS